MFCGWLFVEAQYFFFGHGGFVQGGLWEYSRKAVFLQWKCVEVVNFFSNIYKFLLYLLVFLNILYLLIIILVVVYGVVCECAVGVDVGDGTTPSLFSIVVRVVM